MSAPEGWEGSIFQRAYPNAKWELIPNYMQGAVFRWVERGVPPGDFLSAFLRNDLKETFFRADDCNQLVIRSYVHFFYEYCPSQSWGGGRESYVVGKRRRLAREIW